MGRGHARAAKGGIATGNGRKDVYTRGGKIGLEPVAAVDGDRTAAAKRGDVAELVVGADRKGAVVDGNRVQYSAAVGRIKVARVQPVVAGRRGDKETGSAHRVDDLAQALGVA